MKARILGVDAAEWREVLVRDGHDVYHLPRYVTLMAAYDSGSPAALYVEDGPGRRLLLPVILRDLGQGRQDAISPYGYPGPIAHRGADAEFVSAAMACAVELLAREHVVALFVRLHPLLPIDGLDAVGTLVNHGQTVVIDLSLSEEQLWREMRKNHQRDIARSRRDGCRFAFEGFASVIRGLQAHLPGDDGTARCR